MIQLGNRDARMIVGINPLPDCTLGFMTFWQAARAWRLGDHLGRRTANVFQE
jgi:hypothetical protein